MADSYAAVWRGGIQAEAKTITQTFANFRMVNGARESYQSAGKLAEGKADYCGLTIYGGVGCGKTHLLRAIQHATLARGIECLYYSEPELLTGIKREFDTGVHSILERVKSVPVLLIDQMGHARTDWELDTQFEWFDYRYSAYGITAVALDIDITRLTERLQSRMGDKRWKIVHNTAGDYRARR